MKEFSICDLQFAIGIQIANRQSQIANRTMPTASRDIVVSNTLGLHARPAMQFVDLANSFGSDIRVHKFGDEPGEADGKSVMEMIILAAVPGTKMRIDAEGDDAEEAVTKLGELFDAKFGEED